MSFIHFDEFTVFSFLFHFLKNIFMFSKFGCSFLFYILNLLFFHLHIFQVLTFIKQALLKHRTLESKFHHTKKTWFMDSNYERNFIHAFILLFISPTDVNSYFHLNELL